MRIYSPPSLSKYPRFRSTVRQIRRLVASGCEIVRVAIPDPAAAAAFAEIRAQVLKVPLVADIHFDHRLAIAAVAAINAHVAEEAAQLAHLVERVAGLREQCVGGQLRGASLRQPVDAQ